MEKRSEEGKKAKIDYIKRYNRENYAKIYIDIRKEEKERYKAFAESRGMSLAGLGVAAIEEYIENHGKG